ncbi:hypothetical protein V1503_24465 [Bacillus sp. SCS-151]|uniref:hypothetical protein n=1 Tax=Nanhaiella sioensis TaxID=3115293 RepID=UPI00397C05A7
MDIIYNTEIFNNEQRANLNRFLNDRITELNDHLELESLKSIIVTSDFFLDVIKFQRDHGLSEHGATNTEHGQAVAKVLKHYSEDDKLQQSIIFSDNILYGLFSEKEIANKSFHYLHHELCHIHDNANLERVYSQDGKRGVGLTHLEHMLIIRADIIWREYIVERLSYTTVESESFGNLIGYLLYLIKNIKEVIDKDIQEYRIHANINKFMKCLEENSSLLLKIAATVCGTLHSLKENNEVISMVNDAVEQKGFTDVWDSLNQRLQDLFEKYPNWNDVYELKGLGETVLKYWNTLSVYPEMTKEGMYVSIP